jgi:hypothetical protein
MPPRLQLRNPLNAGSPAPLPHAGNQTTNEPRAPSPLTVAGRSPEATHPRVRTTTGAAPPGTTRGRGTRRLPVPRRDGPPSSRLPTAPTEAGL